MHDGKPDAPAPAFATRAALLAYASRRYGAFTLPSGDSLRFRSLSELEFSTYENASFDRDDEDGKVTVNTEQQRNARARLIVLAVCDALGKRLFMDGDLAAIEELDVDVSLRLYEAIRDHVGLTDAVKRRKAQESLAKN